MNFKKMTIAFNLIMLSLLSTNPIYAYDSNQPIAANEEKACEFTTDPIPVEGEIILLEDNSIVSAQARASSTINVNKVFSVRIQDVGGSCVSSARITLTGSYTYNSSTKKISNVALYAKPTSVPTLWTVTITSQWHTVNGSSLSHSIYYRSSVNDPYSCLVGGGYWYSGATIKVR